MLPKRRALAEIQNGDQNESTTLPEGVRLPQGIGSESLQKLSESLPSETLENQEDDSFELPTSRASVTPLPHKRGFSHLGSPIEIQEKLQEVGYECVPSLATHLSLCLSTPVNRVKSMLLEGPSGAGKSFLAKSIATIAGARLEVLSCYSGMRTENLIESPSTLALASAMANVNDAKPENLLNLGILSRVFLASQSEPVVLLVDELDKPDSSIDTFFLGPIQDGVIWLESRPPIRANLNNLLIFFTKNFNRKIDEALLRRVHPVILEYLNASLEVKILSSFCHPILVRNLVGIADRMRNNRGAYGFERPPAPEELLLAGHYVMRLLQWEIMDFDSIAASIWSIVAKSEHDRAVLEHMMRFHPDFMDPLEPDGKNLTRDQVLRRFGREVLKDIVEDPLAEERARAELEYGAS
jgi:MoxR-like ATPase